MTWFVCMFRNSQTLFDWNGFLTAAFTAGIEGEVSMKSDIITELQAKFQNGLEIGTIFIVSISGGVNTQLEIGIICVRSEPL
jgi:hypothetical protein